MRVIAIPAIALAIIVLLAVPPAAAQFEVGFAGGPVNIGIPVVMGPGFTYASPFAQGSATLQFVNQSALTHAFTCSYALALAEAIAQGPECQTIFSPVIALTTSESIVATRSYFFADFISG